MNNCALIYYEIIRGANLPVLIFIIPSFCIEINGEARNRSSLHSTGINLDTQRFERAGEKFCHLHSHPNKNITIASDLFLFTFFCPLSGWPGRVSPSYHTVWFCFPLIQPPSYTIYITCIMTESLPHPTMKPPHPEVMSEAEPSWVWMFQKKVP